MLESSPGGHFALVLTTAHPEFRHAVQCHILHLGSTQSHTAFGVSASVGASRERAARQQL